jgi:hypothetical protein
MTPSPSASGALSTASPGRGAFSFRGLDNIDIDAL